MSLPPDREEDSTVGNPAALEPLVFRGIGGSSGVAIGKLMLMDTGGPGVVHRHVSRRALQGEVDRYEAAVTASVEELNQAADRAQHHIAKAEVAILEAYVLMLEDDMLHEDVERRILIDRQCAEWAVEGAIADLGAQLRDSPDPYIAARSDDFEFVGAMVQRSFQGRSTRSPAPREAD